MKYRRLYYVHAPYDPLVNHTTAFTTFEEAVLYREQFAKLSKEAVITVTHLYEFAKDAPQLKRSRRIIEVPRVALTSLDFEEG
jgi:hypothetical protein